MIVIKCPLGNHPVYLWPSGAIVPHYRANGELCPARLNPQCDCHTKKQQVCDKCQGVGGADASSEKTKFITEPKEPQSYEGAAIDRLRKELAEQAAEALRVRAKCAASDNMAAILQAELVKAESERRSAATALGVVRCVVGPLKEGESLPDAIRAWRKRVEDAEAGWAKSKRLINLIYEQLRRARGKA